MKSLIEMAVIFFGILMAAALLALSWPAGVELVGAMRALPATDAASHMLACGRSSQSLAAQDCPVTWPGG